MSRKKYPEMTTLEKAQLLSKLLKHIERANKGNTLSSFRKESETVCIKSVIRDSNNEPIIRRIEKAAAERFFKYLVANKHLEKAQDKTMRNCIPDKCRKEGSDPQMKWLMEIVTCNDPFKSRGRIAGQSPRKKEDTSSLLEGVEIVNPQIMEDDVLDGHNEITYLPESAVEPVKEERSPLYAILDQIDPFVIIAYLKEKACNNGLEMIIKLK